MTIRLVSIVAAATACTQSATPLADSATGSAGPACEAASGLGRAAITGAGAQTYNAFAMHEPADTEYSWELSTNPAALVIVMTTTAQLTCETADEWSVYGGGAYIFTAIPASGAEVTAGTYQLEALIGDASTGAGLQSWVSGGIESTGGPAPAQAMGTFTIDNVDGPITGSFSATFGDAVAGGFCAPICEPTD